MVNLFLSEPDWNDNGDIYSAKLMMSLFDQLESVIWSLITSGGRSEARLWLCNTISGIGSITPHQQRELFVSLLRSKPPKLGLAAQLLQMMFEKRPRKAGSIISKRSHILEKFFQGSPRRILQWFSNFNIDGGSEHRKGARALSQFAFVNRDNCWEELEWMGKHGQSPAMVATKPHYFLDLDVQKTVENFIENVPEFWSSDEFSESLEDGEILLIDTKFFADLFVDLMYKEDSRDVWEVVNEFLGEESFSSLCHHLLIILEEHDFCIFLEFLCKIFNQRMEPNNFGNSSYWLEIILYKCGDFESIDQLLLLNAVINQGRQLLRLVRDEEFQDEQVKIKDIVSQIRTTSSNANSLAPIFKACFKISTLKAIKLLGFQSWVIHYRLSEECQTPESCESLLINNGINFRKSKRYGLLPDSGLLKESGSESDDRVSSKTKRKKKSKSKKKRRKFDHDGSYGEELLDFDMSSDRMGLQAGVGSWLLSTDSFSTSWTNADLPDHISKHCLSTWMKWVFDKKSDAT